MTFRYIDDEQQDVFLFSRHSNISLLGLLIILINLIIEYTDTVITVLGQVSSRPSVTYTWPSTCINDLDSNRAIGLHTWYLNSGVPNLWPARPNKAPPPPKKGPPPPNKKKKKKKKKNKK